MKNVVGRGCGSHHKLDNQRGTFGHLCTGHRRRCQWPWYLTELHQWLQQEWGNLWKWASLANPWRFRNCGRRPWTKKELKREGLVLSECDQYSSFFFFFLTERGRRMWPILRSTSMRYIYIYIYSYIQLSTAYI